MATPIEKPHLRYDLVRPDGTRSSQQSSVSGWMGGSRESDVNNLKWFVDLMLHSEPEGSRIENLRFVDARGRDLPDQPDLVDEARAPEAPDRVRAAISRNVLTKREREARAAPGGTARASLPNPVEGVAVEPGPAIAGPLPPASDE